MAARINGRSYDIALAMRNTTRASKHLRTLAEGGVVEARRDGYYVLYSLVPER